MFTIESHAQAEKSKESAGSGGKDSGEEVSRGSWSRLRRALVLQRDPALVKVSSFALFSLLTICLAIGKLSSSDSGWIGQALAKKIYNVFPGGNVLLVKCFSIQECKWILL